MKINLRELNALQPAPLSDAVLVNLTELALARGWVIDKGHITYETVPYDLIVGHEQGMIPSVSWGNLLNGHHTFPITTLMNFFSV